MKILVHITLKKQTPEANQAFALRMVADFDFEEVEHTKARFVRFGVLTGLMEEARLAEIAALPEVLAVERDGAKRPSDLREDG